MGAQPMEIKPPCREWRGEYKTGCVRSQARDTYDVVVLAADSLGRARVAGADTDDGDGRAVEANEAGDGPEDDAEQTEQKVTGVVENMSAMVMPDGTRMEVFGAGGGETIASSLSERLGYPVPLLGSVPLDVTVREASDRGVPAVWDRPDSPAAEQLWAIARALDQQGRGLAGKSLGITPRG